MDNSCISAAPPWEPPQKYLFLKDLRQGYGFLTNKAFLGLIQSQGLTAQQLFAKTRGRLPSAEVIFQPGLAASSPHSTLPTHEPKDLGLSPISKKSGQPMASSGSGKEMRMILGLKMALEKTDFLVSRTFEH